jgi:autophagy-related protein 18
VNLLRCHKTPILKLAMSFLGNMVATSSTQGQMIRVFTLPAGEKLYNLTRGVGAATMYSLNFSNDSAYLLSSSDTGTVHIF